MSGVLLDREPSPAEVRDRLGWTQARLARELGVSRETVSAWERSGRVPRRYRAALRRLLTGAPPPTKPADLELLLVRLGDGPSELARRLDVERSTVHRWRTGAPIRERHQAALRRLEACAPSAAHAVRKHLGVTQAELARRLGVSTQLVTGWEKGKSMSPEHRERLVALFTSAEPPALPAADIVRLRTAKGWSQRELARRLRVVPARVGEWEAGRPVPAKHRGRLAQLLGRQHRSTGELEPEVRALLSAQGAAPLTVAEIVRRFPGHEWAARQAVHRLRERGEASPAYAEREDLPGRQRAVQGVVLAAEAVSSSGPPSAFLGRQLRQHRIARGWSQAALAARLGVSREAVRTWELRGDGLAPVPAPRRRAILETLFTETPPPRATVSSALDGDTLRVRRLEVGLTQGELAARLGLEHGQAMVSAWERKETRITERRAAQLEAALAEGADLPRLESGELRRERMRAGWSQRELADRLGVSAQTVKHWEAGRGAIPRRRWAAIRAVLAAAPSASPVPPAPAADELRAQRDRLGWSQRELAERLGIWQAQVSAWERGHAVPPGLRDRLRAVLEAGEPIDPGAERTAQVLAIVRAEPGLSGRQVMARVYAAWDDVREAIIALRNEGRLHERSTEYRDSAGRACRRAGLYPGPAAAQAAPVLSAQEIVRGRERLDWSQAELARRLDIHQTILWRWEHGQPVPPDEAARLQAVLDAGERELPDAGTERLADVGKLIGPARERLGLSVSEMARRLGVDRQTLVAWESGRRAVSRWRRREVLHALEQLDAGAHSGEPQPGNR